MIEYEVTNNELTIYNYFNYPSFEIDFIVNQIKYENEELEILKDTEYLKNVWATYSLLYIFYLYSPSFNKIIIRESNSKFKNFLFKVCSEIYTIFFY